MADVSFIGFHAAGPVHKAALEDESKKHGLSLSRYLRASVPLVLSGDEAPQIVARQVAPETIHVVGTRDGQEVVVGTLASVLTLNPDGEGWGDGQTAIIISPKEAAGAIVYRAMTGRLSLSPDHMAMIESLRTSYDG